MLNVQLHNPRKRRNPESQTLQQAPSSLHISKKQKHNHNSSSQFPPAFWDNLSKIHLTTRALKELDQRNIQAGLNSRLIRQQLHRPLTRAILAKARKTSRTLTPAVDYLRHCEERVLKSIKQTARHGGPDLSDLRGFPEPSAALNQEMNSSRSSSRAPKRSSRSTPNTEPSTNTTTTKSTGPYNRNFQQNLIDHGVYPDAYEYPDGRVPPQPANWEDINRRLIQPRPSLSPSRFSEEEFRKFKRADSHAAKEKQVTTSVIPIIEGSIGDAKCVSGGIPFTNLDHLTDGTLVPGNPDMYYGARPEQLDRQVRNELGSHIIPSTQDDLPIVPNFFLAAKGPDGSLAVANRQASYDGALGARGMRSLQSYQRAEPVIDNNAYTITSIYHGGQLKMYTSHATQSTSPGGRPEYYTHQLRSFAMADTAETFRQGAMCYRNARDWAKEQRDEAIRRANERAVEQPAERPDIDSALQHSPSCSNETTIEEGFRSNEESRSLLDETTNTTADLEELDASCELALGALYAKRPSQHPKHLSQTQKKRRHADISNDLSEPLELQTPGPSGLSQQFGNQNLEQEQEQDSQLSENELQPIDPTETPTGTDLSAQTAI